MSKHTPAGGSTHIGPLVVEWRKDAQGAYTYLLKVTHPRELHAGVMTREFYLDISPGGGRVRFGEVLQ